MAFKPLRRDGVRAAASIIFGARRNRNYHAVCLAFVELVDLTRPPPSTTRTSQRSMTSNKLTELISSSWSTLGIVHAVLFLFVVLR